MASSSSSPRSPWLTLSNSALLCYLYQFKPPPNTALSEQANRAYVHFRTERYLLYGIMVFNFLRLVHLTYRFNSGDSLADQQPYFPLMVFGLETFHFASPSNLLILNISSLIFTTAFDYFVCFRVEHFLYRLAYQLMIQNGQQFLELNQRRLSSRPQFCFRRTPQWFAHHYRLGQSIWNSKRLCFKHHQLADFPNISAQLRARLVVFSLAIEWSCAALCRLAVLVLATAEVYLLLQACDRLPFSSLALFLLDCSLICYITLNAIRVSLLPLHLCLLLSFISNRHIGQLTAQLRQVVHQSKLARCLSYFQREYTSLKHIAQYTNSAFVSPVFAVMVYTIIALSILILSHLLFNRLLLSEELAMIAFFCAIVLIPLLGCLAMTAWSDAFYRSESALFSAQRLLGRRSSLQPAKVKLMAFHEVVCTKAKFRFTIGSFGHISKRSLYEFFFAYSGMVMYVSGMIRDGQHQ